MLKIVDNSSEYFNELFTIQSSSLPIQDQMSKELFFDEFNRDNRKYFVALFSREVVGYIGLNFYDDDLNIISFAVKNSFQNKGIGSALLLHAKNFAKKQGKKSLSLEVDENNLKAINFYKKHNFVVTNIRKNYYKSNDAFVMFLYL